VIHEPEFDPLLHSFHEEKSVEATMPSKISSFRECFEVNNEIIMAKEGKDKLLKFTKAGKIANFIEAAHPRQTPRNSTIVDIISERNAKRSIDSYCHLREKSRATETLSERIKSLESFNKNLRIKQLVKNQ
jgi:hemin uptake protein HemP